MNELAFSRAHFPVRSLGYGRRVGIWFQGCSIRCSGCVVPETWDARPEHRVRIDDLVATLQPWLEDCDGVTISGGEPFDQSEALASLLTAMRARIAGDILVFSGYTETRLRTVYPKLAARPDAIVAGPFRAELSDDRPFVGSRNQVVICNSALGLERYASLERYERRLDVDVAPGEILMAGVPRRGEMARIVAELSREGIAAELTHGSV